MSQPPSASGQALGRVLAAIVFVALSAGIIWAGYVRDANLLSEGAALLAMPWGFVTLLDLYAGFVLYAVLVFAFEPRKVVALVWVLPVFVLGNLVMAAWVIFRLPGVLKRLNPA
jgi:hypothetical protein